MRFLSSFLFLFMMVLVFGISGFLLVREYFFYQAVKDFKHSVVNLNKAGRDAIAQCAVRETDLVVNSGGETILQLRFTSDKDYVLEVICREFSFDPIEISSHELGPYVTKKPGTSGIVLNQGRSAVELVIFDDLTTDLEQMLGRDLNFLRKEKIVGVDNSYVTETLVGDDLGVGPATSCEGYGFECCDPVAQRGVGEQRDGVRGCESGCFQACTARPAVLSFTSNPFFDVANRQVQIKPGEIIDFNYVVDSGATENVAVRVDFGDGQVEDLDTKTGSLSHAYTCAVDSCTYTAIVTAVDGTGTDSVVSSVSKIQVVVGTPPPQAEIVIE